MAKIAALPRKERIKNIAKSFGYATIDAAGSLNPTLAKVAKETKMVATEVSYSVKELADGNVSQAVKDFLDPNGDNAINNIINDFKTGKWYNKERADSMGFDDLDFGGDFEDWGDGDDDFSSMGGDDEGSSSSESTASAMIGGMQNLSSDIAVSMGRSSAASAEYIAKSGHRDTMAVYDLTRTGFTNVSTLLMNINSKLDAVLEVSAPLVTQAQNTFAFQTRATEFFESTNETLSKMNASLEQIAANTAILNPTTKRSRRDKSLGSLIIGDEFDLSGYFDMVKQNAKEQADFIKGIADMGGFMLGKNMKNLSPMALAMTAGVSALVPQAMKEAMKDFNLVIEGSIPALLKSLKAKGTGSNSIFGSLLADILLPDITFKNKINKGNYEKGPVAWDGIARKSLVEVIPTYLAKIYGALGGEELYYDFKRGIFSSKGAMRNELWRQKANDAKLAGGDFRDAAIREAAKYDKAGSAKYQKEIANYFINALDSGDDYRKIKSKKRDTKFLQQMGLSAQSAEILDQVVTKMLSERKGATDLLKYSMALSAAQAKIDKRFRDEEASGYSNLNYLDNGFSEKRKPRFSQIGYLDGIYTTVGNIYALLANGTFDAKTGRVRRVGAGAKEGSNMMSTKERLMQKYSQEQLYKFRMRQGLLGAGDKYAGMTEEEIERAKRQEEIEKEAKEVAKKAKSKVSETITKVRNWFRKKTGRAELSSSDSDVPGPFGDFMNASTDVLNTLTKGISDLFYGDHEEEGIIAAFKKLISDTTSEIRGSIKKYFMKNVWEPIKGTVGNAVRGFRQRGRQKQLQRDFGYSDADSWELAGDILDQEEADRRARRAGTAAVSETEVPGLPQHARGRNVTRSGLVVVSEGELIIPSEYNPFYRGKTNKRRQIANERRIANRFYGTFREGGIPISERTAERFRNFGSAAKDTIDDAAGAIAGGVSHFISAIIGNLDEKGIQEQKKKLNEGIGKIFKDMGMNQSAMAIGALGGVGVSLLTGAFVGPIAGAAIGAGVGLISKSETLQKMLFGEIVEDEHGNKVDKRTFIGVAKDYIKDGVANVLKNAKEKITPQMIAGAGIGALIGGPFGIVGGALIGGATGFLATTEKFKIFMFGTDEDKENPEKDQSFTGLLRNKVFNNLDEIFHNTGNMLKGLFKDLGIRATNFLKNFFEDRKKAMMRRLGQSFLGKAVAKVGAAAGAVVKAPVRLVGGALGGINKGLQRFNLGHGYNIYNREEKRNMTAQERLERRKDLGFFGRNYSKGQGIDEQIASASPDDLFAMQEEIQALQGSKYAKKFATNKNMEALYSGLESSANFGGFIKGSHKKKFDALMRAGKAEAAIDYLQSLGYNTSDIENLINETAAKNSNASSAEKAVADIRKKLKKAGIDLGTDPKGQRALDLINDEIQAKGLTRESIEEKEAEKEQIDRDATQFGLLAAIVKALDPTANVVGIAQGKYKPILAKSEISKFGGTGADNGIKTERGTFGIKQYTEDASGEVKYQTNDTETDETMQREQTFFKAMESVPTVADELHGFGGIFTKLGEKLFGNGEDEEGKKKEGFFEKITKLLTGDEEGSVFSLIKQFILPILAAGGLTAVLAASIFGKDKDKGYKNISDASEGHTGLFDSGSGAELATDARGNIKTTVGEDGETYAQTLNGDLINVSDLNVKANRIEDSHAKNFRRYFTHMAVGGKGIVESSLGTVGGALSHQYNKQSKSKIRKLLGLGISDKAKARNFVGSKLSGWSNKLYDARMNLGKKIGNKVIDARSTSAISKALGVSNVEASTIKDLLKGGATASDIKDFFPSLSDDAIEALTKSAGSNVDDLATPKAIKAMTSGFNSLKKKTTSAMTAASDKFAEIGSKMVNKSGRKAAAESAEESAEKLVTEAAKKSNLASFVDEVADGIRKLFKKIKELFGPRMSAELVASLDDMGVEAGEKIGGELAEQATKNTAAKAGVNSLKAVPVAGWIFAVVEAAWEFEEGWNRAARDFKVNEATTFEKAANGIIEAIISLIGVIPGAGGLIATIGASILKPFVMDTIINIFIRLGFMENLAKRRKESKEEYDQYVAEQKAAGVAAESYDKWNAENKSGYTWGENIANTVVAAAKNVGAKLKANQNSQRAIVEARHSNTATGYSGGSSFINQRNNAYANSRFANSTFAEKGCGPAVASMAASALGKNLSLGSAVRGSQGYQNSVGVDAGYFGDVLGKSGISTQYVSGAGAAGQLAAGNKVILLGQDASNRSKTNSPFGPGSHYVLATGMRNGKVMINDPENNGPRAYSPSILRNVRMGIAAGASGLMRIPSFLRRFFSGAGSDQDISDIWGFLKNQGFSDVQIAGIMGCWEAESHNSPDTLEANYGSTKVDPNDIMSDNAKMNDYTVNTVFPKHKVSQKRQSAYIGNDGNYYPGYGLAQWTGPRQQQLISFAQANNMDHRALSTQLAFFMQEYQNRPALKNALSKATTVEEATKAVLDFYEMYNGFADNNPGKYNQRIGYANTIFNQMNGQAGTMPASSGAFSMNNGVTVNGDGTITVAGSKSGSKSNTSTGSVLGFVSEFSNLWSKAFGGLFGNNAFGEDDSEIGESDASVNPNAIMAAMSGSPSEIMKSIQGKLEYSQKGPRNPELGSADCSSTVQWAVRKAGGPDIGSYTGAMYDNPNLTPVWYNNGTRAEAMPSEAQKDDVLLFARSGGYGADHVGHVGLYLGDNQYIHHGGPGKGPTIATFKPGSKLIKVSRITGLGDGGAFTATTTPQVMRYNQASAQQLTAAQENVKAIRKAGITNAADAQRLVAAQNDVSAIQNANTISGGASGMSFNDVNWGHNSLPASVTTSDANIETVSGNKPKIDIEMIVRILQTIATNTTDIAKIANIIDRAFSGGASGVQNSTTPTGKSRSNNIAIAASNNSNIDQDIVNLVGTLAALAKG